MAEVEDFDVVIVGGGFVGLALAIALKDSSLKVAMIEARPYINHAKQTIDGRSFALSAASIRILQQLGVWCPKRLKATLIKHIHVSERLGFAATRLHASDHDMDAFGAVVEHDALMQYFYEQLKQIKNLKLWTPAVVTDCEHTDEKTSLKLSYDNKDITVSTKMMIAADGANSSIRKRLNLAVHTHAYYQHALVCNIQLKRSHQYTAFERFLDDEMMALLPLSDNRQALVWVMSPLALQERLSLSDEDFITSLQSTFGYRLGRFLAIGQRNSFPLTMSYLCETVHNHVVFIGNAAHSLHPIAGQGLNLGLRDVAFMAETLFSIENGMSLHKALEHYQQMRIADQRNIRLFTDNLVKTFSYHFLGMKFMRSLALMLMDGLVPLQSEFVQFAAGFSANNARLVSGVPLSAVEQRG